MFDTLKYVKILEEAGVSRDQAETHVRIVSEVMENNLATRQDVLDVKADFKHEISLLRQDMLLLEQRMTIKLGTIVSIAIGVAVTLAKIVG